MRCDHCGEQVPEGVFCTRCGAHQSTTAELENPKDRTHSYAAHPGEHVAHAAVFTTLFPHLGHRKIHEFRWALVAGTAAILLLYISGLVPAALLAAAFLIPVLYLMYLYEAQVYKDEPARVIGFTFGGGIVLGVLVAVIASRLSNPVTFSRGVGGIDFAQLILFTVILAVVQEVVKPIPALILRGPRFPETMDGLTFGIAAGLGFSVAESLVNFSSVFTQVGVRTDPANWIFPLMTAAILQPLMQASATGIVAAAFWRMGRGSAGQLEMMAVAAAVVGHVLFWLVPALVVEIGASKLFSLMFQALVVAGLLVLIRYILHYALLEEAADLGFAQTVCPNCHRHILAAGFCPNCGMAMTAVTTQVSDARVPIEAAPPAPSQGGA